MPYSGVQGIKWSQMVDRVVRSIHVRRGAMRYGVDGEVTQRSAGGAPQGFWPAALRGRLPDVGEPSPAKERRVARVGAYPYVDRRAVAMPQRMLADTHPGRFDATETTDTLYFDGGFQSRGALAALPAWARRFYVGRSTHVYNESWATPTSYGAEGTWSGPSGTLVLYPLPMRRRMSSPAAATVGGKLARGSGARRVNIPGVTVVQAAGTYP